MIPDPTDPETRRRAARLLLRARGEDGRREEFYLAGGLTIGPGRGNTVVLPEAEAAAPTYARIEVGEGGALLRCVGPAGSVVAAGGAVRELPLDEGVRFRVGRTEFECIDGRRADAQAPPREHVRSLRATFEAARGAYARAERKVGSDAGRWAMRGALILGATALVVGGPIGLIVAVDSRDWGALGIALRTVALMAVLGLITGGLAGLVRRAIVGVRGPGRPASTPTIRGPVPAGSRSVGEVHPGVGRPAEASASRATPGRSDAPPPGPKPSPFAGFSPWSGKALGTVLVWGAAFIISVAWHSSRTPEVQPDVTKPGPGVPASQRAESAASPPEAEAVRLARGCFDRGVGHAREGEWELAVADFTEAIRLDPTVAQAYSQRGAANSGKGDHRAAIADFAEAIRLDPAYGGGFTHRGNAYMKVNEIGRAIADFDEAIRREPTGPVNHELRGVCRLKRGDCDGAIADLDEAIRLDPDFTMAYFQRGEAYFAKAQHCRAIADYSEAIRREPNSATAFLGRGIARRSDGAYDLSIADLSEAIRLDPRLAAAYLNRAVTHLERGDPDGALADLDRAIAIAPRDAGGWSMRGTIHHLRGREEQAVADLTWAIQIDPSDIQARNVRGLAYSARGDQDRAIADFDAAIGLAPRGATAYGNRGLARLRNREFDRAVADCDEAIARDPREAEAYLTKGIALMSKGDLGGATAALTRAMDFPQARARAYPVRGRCHQSRGMYDEAIADFREAIRLDPQDAENSRERLREAESARRSGGR